jgi:hypothetical protein
VYSRIHDDRDRLRQQFLRGCRMLALFSFPLRELISPFRPAVLATSWVPAQRLLAAPIGEWGSLVVASSVAILACAIVLRSLAPAVLREVRSLGLGSRLSGK